tara:strand:- start:2375 stop:2548 length:174 start_codon:yes stop_codon:yes gene_type:complete
VRFRLNILMPYKRASLKQDMSAIRCREMQKLDGALHGFHPPNLPQIGRIIGKTQKEV